MIPLVIQGSTHRLNGLPIRASVDEGTPILESAWEPSTEELAILCDGGSIVLRIYGCTQPPVAIYVTPHASETEPQNAE